MQDAATYAGTSFEGHDNPWYAFAEYFIYARRNGISSHGQSVLSSKKFEAFIKDPQFVGALAELVEDPNRDHFIKFTEAWDNARKKYGAIVIGQLNSRFPANIAERFTIVGICQLPGVVCKTRQFKAQLTLCEEAALLISAQTVPALLPSRSPSRAKSCRSAQACDHIRPASE